MSRRRPGISAGTGALSWAARNMTVEPAVFSCAAAAAPIVRRVHPVVETSHSRWFRVIRLFKTRDGLQVEDIGEFPHMTEAILLGSREVGRARVLDGNGKLMSDNGQLIESRA